MTDTRGTDGLEKMILRDLQRDYKGAVKLRLTRFNQYDGFDVPKIALMTPEVDGEKIVFFIDAEYIWMARIRRWSGRDTYKNARRCVSLARPNYKDLFRKELYDGLRSVVVECITQLTPDDDILSGRSSKDTRSGLFPCLN